MGRKRILTDEQRRQRHREAQRKIDEKKRILNAKLKELNSLEIDFFRPKSREPLTEEAREHIRMLLNMPIQLSKTPKRDRTKANRAKKQIGLGMSKLKEKHINSIDFDLSEFDEDDKKYFFEQLPQLIYKLLEVINLNEQWTVYYLYDNCWKQREIDSFTSNYLKEQLDNELKDNMSWVEYSEQHSSGQSFFPISIKELTQLRFINEDEIGLRGRAKKSSKNELLAKDFRRKDDYVIYKTLIDAKTPKKIIEDFVRKHIRNRRQGQFWKWINTFEEINLEVFGIFNEISSRTIKLMENDNCFIYSCKQFGLRNDLIDDMKCCIKKRAFSLSDIRKVSEALDLSFEIKFINDNGIKKNKIISKNNPNLIKLILYKEHYMINRKINISPYYIKHREEINKNVKRMSLQNKLMINGYDIRNNKKIYTKANKPFSVIKVLRALFEANAFRPIKLNEIYDNLCCFEDVLPDDDLSFDIKLCAKLIE